ncbi:ricin-type beta-trefoil lectin domain protein [Ceratobasidium sp. AG-Ba]|nr:ricin-type beta-trefoil lectin domain protein [Ceratobasidium sp. AG-Ba]
MQPGTFKIINAKSGTALTASEGHGGDVFCWEKHGGRSQLWFLQSSGAGWKIKNCANGQYLTASNTDNVATVYCGKYPISWELAQGPTDHDLYIIKFAGCDRIFDLSDWGSARNGTKVYLCMQLEWMAHRRWKFERFGDDTGEDHHKLLSQIKDKNQELLSRDQRITELAATITTQVSQMNQLNETNRQLQVKLDQAQEHAAGIERELAKLRADHSNCHKASTDRTSMQEALDRAHNQIRDRDIEILKQQLQSMRKGRKQSLEATERDRRIAWNGIGLN